MIASRRVMVAWTYASLAATMRNSGSSTRKRPGIASKKVTKGRAVEDIRWERPVVSPP
jgi:hypothetical protein